MFLWHAHNSLTLYYVFSSFFFFNDTATTEIYTLSLHDALPILRLAFANCAKRIIREQFDDRDKVIDRKSTRLNSSHHDISYAVFCLKTKKHTSDLQSPRYFVCRLLVQTT